MKRSVVFSSVIIAAIVSGFFVYFKSVIDSSNVDQSLSVDTVKSMENPNFMAVQSTEISSSYQMSKKEAVEKFTDETLMSTDSIDKGINKALNGDVTEADLALEMIKSRFPELKKDIDRYQQNVAQQKDKLSEYQDLVQQRNSDISKYGYVSLGIKVELEQKKTELISESQKLGMQAMKLNEAIRLAANIN